MTATELCVQQPNTETLHPGGLLSRGFGRITGEFFAAGLVAVATSVVVQWLLGRIHVAMPSFAPQVIASVIVAVLVLAGFWLAVRSRSSLASRIMAWAGLAALVSAVFSLMLLGNKFYLDGTTADHLFRMEYVT